MSRWTMKGKQINEQLNIQTNTSEQTNKCAKTNKEKLDK